MASSSPACTPTAKRKSSSCSPTFALPRRPALKRAGPSCCGEAEGGLSVTLNRRSVPAGAAAVTASPLLESRGAFAQAYPNKPIKIVVPFAAGSATDLTARGLAAKLQEILKQPIIVDDKPGASGQLGASAVATSPADGYTLLMGTNSTNAANVALFKKLSYDPERDFA